MAPIAVLLTCLSLIVTLWFGHATSATHDQWLCGALIIALAVLQFVCRLRSSVPGRLLGMLIIALGLALLATYLMPRSWVSLSEWNELLAAVPYATPLYLQRPLVLALLALCMTTLSTLLAARHIYIRLFLLMMSGALTLTQLFMPTSLPSDLHPTPPLALTLATALLIAAQACTLQLERGSFRRYLLLPAAISLVVLTGTLFAWHYQSEHNQHVIVNVTRNLGDRVAEKLWPIINEQQQAMRRFASAWTLFERVPSYHAWQHQAQAIQKDFPYLRMIAYLAPDGRVLRVYPRQDHATLTGRHFFSEIERSKLYQTLTYGEEDATAMTDLPRGERGIMYFIPMLGLQTDKVIGAVAYALSPTALFETQRATIERAQIRLTVSEHDHLLFETQQTEPLSAMKYCNLVTVGDDSLTVCVQPTLSRLYQERSLLPEVTLIIGLIFAFLLFNMMYFLLRLRHKHSQVSDTNQSLRHEVNKRIALQQEVEWLARHDELTQLPNRRYFMEHAHAHRAQVPLAIMIIDLDYFKSINDQLGHQEGDRYLRMLARAARVPIEAQAGMLARYGGEEFIACLPQCSLQQAQQLAEQVRHAVMALCLPQPATGQCVTVSIGIALSNETHGELSMVIQAADQALYSAKHGGRNRVEYAMQ